jgi:hypothetical protein
MATEQIAPAVGLLEGRLLGARPVREASAARRCHDDGMTKRAWEPDHLGERARGEPPRDGAGGSGFFIRSISQWRLKSRRVSPGGTGNGPASMCLAGQQLSRPALRDPWSHVEGADRRRRGLGWTG